MSPIKASNTIKRKTYQSHPYPISPGYRLIDRIGRGAGSIVLRAEHLRSGRMVAIKHVSKTLLHEIADANAGPGGGNQPENHVADSKSYYGQVRAEYAVLSQLGKTPVGRYVPGVFDFVTSRTFLLKAVGHELVMEYLPGKSLKEERGRSIRNTIQVFYETARILYGIHASGFVHADLKPQHIIISPRGGPKLIDFGQARKPRDGHARVQGTPDFMAPEQLNGGIIDERTDVYGLGATFFWIFSGQSIRPSMLSNDPNHFTIDYHARPRDLRHLN